MWIYIFQVNILLSDFLILYINRSNYIKAECGPLPDDVIFHKTKRGSTITLIALPICSKTFSSSNIQIAADMHTILLAHLFTPNQRATVLHPGDHLSCDLLREITHQSQVKC